jgi:hypothetical protein
VLAAPFNLLKFQKSRQSKIPVGITLYFTLRLIFVIAADPYI